MATPIEKLSAAMTPAQVVAVFQSKGIAVSERTLRERARKIGAYHIIGKVMFLLPDDLEALMEATKAKPSKGYPKSSSGWTEQDTDDLIKRIEDQQKAKARKVKRST